MKNFDDHWKQHSFQEIPLSKRIEAEKFLAPAVDYIHAHQSVLILDAGCGDGVHVHVLSQMLNNFGHYAAFGIDISDIALHIAKTRTKNHWNFLQSDLGNIPFKDDQFDVVFSFGVLAYTDDPLVSFTELYRVAKPGGYIGIWIYPRTKGLGGLLLSCIRKLCQTSGTMGCRIIADMIVPFLCILPTRSKLNLVNASWKQCREIVLVNIAPSQLYYPEASEVEGWFHKNQITIVHRDEDAPVTLWGKKCS